MLVTRGWARGPPPAEPPLRHTLSRVPRRWAASCGPGPGRAVPAAPRWLPAHSLLAVPPGCAPAQRSRVLGRVPLPRPRAPAPALPREHGSRWLAIFTCLRAVPGHGHRDVSGTWRTLDRRLLLPPVITGCIWGSRGRHRPFFEDERYPWKSRPWDRRRCAEVAWDEGSSHPIPGLGPR